MNAPALTDDEIAAFLRDGYVRIRRAIAPEVAEAAVDEAFERLGYDRHDPATWAEEKVHLPGVWRKPIEEIAPRFWAAACQLLGGVDRVKPMTLTDAYIVNLRHGAGQPHQPPSPAMKGWHKDGDFFRHFLDSPEQGLLSIVAWSDVRPRGGATYFAKDSVPVVARYLAAHPEGVDPSAFSRERLIDQCHEFGEAIAEAGDIFLMHPFLLHSASPNTIGAVRVITNPPVQLREPMQFNRNDPADFSPVELAVLRGLGVERYDFQPTGAREAIEPVRHKLQRERLEQERARASSGV